MKCSIVIRAFNEAEHLGLLFEGIRRQTVTEPEIILVDSGSQDHTVQMALQNGARIVHIAPEQFSFGRSLNMGIAAASGEYVVIASAHVRPVYPDWLEHLLRPLEDSSVGLAYGKQRGTSRSSFSEHQIFRQWFPEEDNRDQASPFCNNANAAIRRSLWQEQGYDEELTGLEDIAWARWAAAQGHRIVYASHAEVIHVHAESPLRVYQRYRREGMAFKRIFPESHFSIYDFGRLTLLNIMRDIQDAVRGRAAWEQSRSIVWFRTMQFWGTFQGYRNSSGVTQALRQTFYYPPRPATAGANRDVEPISYKEAKP